MALQNEFRYGQSYNTARLVLSLTHWFRGLALVLIVAGVVLGFFTRAALNSSIILFCCYAALVFVLSVVFEALARLLVMVTDIAVNSSPHLTNDEKATIVERNWQE